MRMRPCTSGDDLFHFVFMGWKLVRNKDGWHAVSQRFYSRRLVMSVAEEHVQDLARSSSLVIYPFHAELRSAA